MHHDDETKDWKISAQKALGERRFEDFFRTLPSVNNDESCSLLYDAIKIAKQQKNLSALNAVTSLSLNDMTARKQELLFSDLIDAWVDMGEIEKAISSVVLYENDAIPLDNRWNALGYSLLRKDFLTKYGASILIQTTKDFNSGSILFKISKAIGGR